MSNRYKWSKEFVEWFKVTFANSVSVETLNKMVAEMEKELSNLDTNASAMSDSIDELKEDTDTANFTISNYVYTTANGLGINGVGTGYNVKNATEKILSNLKALFNSVTDMHEYTQYKFSLSSPWTISGSFNENHNCAIVYNDKVVIDLFVTFSAGQQGNLGHGAELVRFNCPKELPNGYLLPCIINVEDTSYPCGLCLSKVYGVDNRYRLDIWGSPQTESKTPTPVTNIHCLATIPVYNRPTE